MHTVEYLRVGQHDYYEKVLVAQDRNCTIENSALCTVGPRFRALADGEWHLLGNLIERLPSGYGAASNDDAFRSKIVVRHQGQKKEFHLHPEAECPNEVSELVTFLRDL